MKQQLENIEKIAKQELSECSNVKLLDDLRVKYLGKKGELKSILNQMGKLAPEERKEMGQFANRVKSDIENAISEKLEILKAKCLVGLN